MSSDGYYFFNPFEENLYHASECFDQSVALGASRFSRDVALAEVALDLAPLGMRVVTYHGFGGRMPITYRLLHAEARGVGVLRHWMKTAPGRSRLREGQLEMLLRDPPSAAHQAPPAPLHVPPRKSPRRGPAVTRASSR